MGINTEAYCDVCGEGYIWDGIVSKSIIIFALRKNGYTIGKKILCPKHKRGGDAVGAALLSP